MGADLLAEAAWRCISTPPGAVAGPEALPSRDADGWLTSPVPGTAAEAVRAALGETALVGRSFDDEDWWFVASVDGAAADGPHLLELDGLATVADVWLDGRHVLRSSSMWRSWRVELDRRPAEVVIRCAALGPALAGRRPRPRWRTGLVASQNLRWVRTTLLGRMPGWAPDAAPVGPWRPVRLVARDAVVVRRRTVTAAVAGADGVVDVLLDIELPRGVQVASGTLRAVAGDTVADLEIPLPPDGGSVAASLTVPNVRRWWPHTHGDQPLYDLVLVVDGVAHPLGAVGFRTVEIDDADDGFVIVVNGRRIFARGACWVPPDVVTLRATSDVATEAVAQAAEAGLNLLRMTGSTAYAPPEILDACDRLGVMVWQDAMLSTLDPPDDGDVLDDLAAELDDVCTGLGGRPSVVVVAGGEDTLLQPTLMGRPFAGDPIPALDEVIPAALRRGLPGTPYVAGTPGGLRPHHARSGTSAWFGVGAYLRPLADARRAEVRFAAQCLAFSVVPERDVVERDFGGAARAWSDPAWRRGVPRDNGVAWDFEDVRDHYVASLFDVDPGMVRRTDPERALDLGRAAVAHVMAETLTEWRRPGSGCAGAVVLAWRDVMPGAGWGLVGVEGRAKSPWYALRRVLAPVAVLLTDEGLDGLDAHVVNDRPTPLHARLRVRLFSPHGRCVEEAVAPVDLDPHAATTVGVESVLGAFRDLTGAWRFGPAPYDAVQVSLLGDGDETLSEQVHLVGGQVRPRRADLGLRAVVGNDGSAWWLDVSTAALAQWVALDVPGYEPADSWFHLVPGAVVRVPLRRLSATGAPRGSVRALNGTIETAIEAAPDTAQGVDA